MRPSSQFVNRTESLRCESRSVLVTKLRTCTPESETFSFSKVVAVAVVATSEKDSSNDESILTDRF